MSDGNLYLDHAKEMLKVFLEEPKSSFEFIPLRSKFGKWDESTIRACLRGLKTDSILNETNVRGRPKRGKKKKSYQIITSSKVFMALYHKFYKDDIEELLDSNYANLFIKQCGINAIYKIIESDIERTDFRRISTRILLNHPSTIAEYEKIAEEFYLNILETIEQLAADSNGSESLRILSYIRDNIDTKSSESLGILGNLDPLQAVEFYRKTIYEKILQAIKKLAEESIISEGIESFLAFDMYLSPLTSYPINDVNQLILSPNPFQRIFEDAYLINEIKFEVLAGRAHSIYTFFADFILEILKYNHLGSNDLVTKTKELIFHWNVASTRFDYICFYLAPELSEDRRGSGNYHLEYNGITFQIFDLENGESFIPEEGVKKLLQFGSIPCEFEKIKCDFEDKFMKDPFSHLRPCWVFEDMGWRSDYIPIESILTELESKLAENDETFT